MTGADANWPTARTTSSAAVRAVDLAEYSALPRPPPRSEPQQENALWSHDWQSRWSHELGRRPATPVPC